MSDWRKEYFDKFYGQIPGFKQNMDIFYELISENVDKESHVLEIGAGPSNRRSKYVASISKELIGLDVDPDVSHNKWLAQGVLYEGGEFPLASNNFDAALSVWVNEHLANPIQHCQEVYRVLKPGGKYFFNTPNRWHYATMIANNTPYWFHRLVVDWVRGKKKFIHDPYPTFFRLNSDYDCRLILETVGFEVETLLLTEMAPVYLQFAKPAYLLGVAYERLVNASDSLKNLRQNILCVAKKPR